MDTLDSVYITVLVLFKFSRLFVCSFACSVLRTDSYDCVSFVYFHIGVDVNDFVLFLCNAAVLLPLLSLIVFMATRFQWLLVKTVKHGYE